MVCFECSKCNETIKKPKVMKHLEMCGSYYVSCIDCHKVFDWESWEAHTSCVSEAQKYQGKLYEAKDNANKGQVKQDAWVDNIEKKIEDPASNVSPQTRTLLQKLLGFNNIPRKQKPFGNFVKNSLKIWDDRKIGEMWEVIAAANAKPPPAPAVSSSAEAVKEAPKEAKEEPAHKDKESNWVGWKRALDDELEGNSGELTWHKLRDALVGRYRASGEANGTSEEHLRNLALSEIPEAYLSEDDTLVRLPKKKKAKKQ